MKKIFSIMCAGLLAVSLTGCRDDFAEMNTDPSAVSKADISYLFAEAVNNFKPDWYLEYYYNAPMVYQWAGWGQSTGGAGEGLLTLTATGDQGYMYLNTLKYVRDMENVMAADESLHATYDPYYAAAQVLTIYTAIFDTDMYGSIPYDEACTGKYDGGTITPTYNDVQYLYDEWLTTLDDCIKKFTAEGATMTSTQDVVYAGDCAKWAKFANSLKLRIAVRYYNQDAAKAKSIVSAVKSASCGYIATTADDVMFNKATVSSENNDFVYHWENGFTGCAASKHVMDFMIGAQDPRLRFFYKKNSWNSKIVNEYLAEGRTLPSFIDANVEKTADGKGFKAWKNLGEPWVRYYGITDEWNAYNNLESGDNKWYWPSNYGKSATETQIYDADGKNGTTYTSYSTLQQMMIIGRSYTATAQVQGACLPGKSSEAVWTENSRPWYGLYMSAGEVNLYLAEFAAIDGDLASARSYYNTALEASCKEFDALSEKNQIAYRASIKNCFTYDPNEEPIDLQDGEVATMLNSDNYRVDNVTTKKEMLEKIYLQEMVHFTLYPNEVYVTARRSGYPSYNSKWCARPSYSEVPSSKIPRRFPTGAITDEDKMGPNRKAAYDAQGLTVSSDGIYNSCIATERLWMDKNAPEWGAGTNIQ